jgi:hypothetical protein
MTLTLKTTVADVDFRILRPIRPPFVNVIERTEGKWQRWRITGCLVYGLSALSAP